MKHKVAFSVLSGSVLVGLIALGTRPTQADPDSRPASEGVRSPKVDAPTLAFEGKAEVSLVSDDDGASYLSFFPLEVKAPYEIAIPVDRGGRADQTVDSALNAWVHVGGSMVLRFNRNVTVLELTVTTEGKATLSQVFVLDHKDKTPAEFSRRAEAFTEFMRTGTFPMLAEVEAEFAARQEEIGIVAGGPPPEQNPKSCSCSTPCCTCSVNCPSNAITAVCGCSGCTCDCRCSLPAA